jgi:hypothetical protein
MLFIFKNIDWMTLQLIFRIIHIQLSGGSLSRRHYLSTSEFNLSKYLFLLGVEEK